MKRTPEQNWDRFKKYYSTFASIDLSMDLSRMDFPENFFAEMEQPMQKAFRAMVELEKGAIANKDEERMVGHYWLRNPALAPDAATRKEIEDTVAAIKSFAAAVHGGTIHGARGHFKNILLIGIGGSALGPQFVSHALGNPTTDKMDIFFFDNTDPDGMDKVLSKIIVELGQTLCIVISKSGGTKETRNGMFEAKAAFEAASLDFGQHAVAITRVDSDLDKYAVQNKWLKRFPMWDWVGGRTSETSAVGLLPAALQGFNIDSILAGAKTCDDATRTNDVKANPSALLSLAWYASGNGKGTKDMVILPYKDRLELFSRYAQQLVMESLGKEKDVDGKVVNQGLAVYGNKGSTDQHAYIQQLADGVNNFFAIFIQVLKDRRGQSMKVEGEITSGDFLAGFLQGTKEAFEDHGRKSMTMTISEVNEFSVGVLIALFERSVGYYASLININAYHQPGVEAGKKAAGKMISIEVALLEFLKRQSTSLTIEQIAKGIDTNEFEIVFRICEHLVANAERGLVRTSGKSPFDATYKFS